MTKNLHELRTRLTQLEGILEEIHKCAMIESKTEGSVSYYTKMSLKATNQEIDKILNALDKGPCYEQIA